MQTKGDGMIWADLLHLGYNMWADRQAPERDLDYFSACDELAFDEKLWRDLLDEAVAAGANMVVIDLGEGVRYASHPEIGVKGSWSPDKLRAELARMRAMGLEPIPKLNFSACHDAWLGSYARMVSTDTYYAVCRDLIAEVIELFDGPRFFHLGMDEETARHQRFYAYVVIRQYDLWWHDLYFFIDQVERGGSRPWVWSDYVWEHADVFYDKMPRSVLQSNWYYQPGFGIDIPRTKAYLDLDAAGYDQVPTGSTWTAADNLERTVRFWQETIGRNDRIKGFLQTVWRPTVEAYRQKHVAGFAALRDARAAWEESV